MESCFDTLFVRTPLANLYSDSNRFDLEMRSIFYKEWIYALHESQIPEPGNFMTMDIVDKPLLFVRGNDNIIRCFYNVCIHRGHILTNGFGKTDRFVCPYHAWTYNTEGQLCRTGAVKNHAGLPETCRSLIPINIENINGFIFVRISKHGDSWHEKFSSFFSELRQKLPKFENLKFTRRFTATVDGNWKLMIENYLECYHCAVTHPALVDLLKIKDFKIKLSPYHLSTQALARRCDSSAYHFSNDENSQNEFFGWWLWPNLTFNIFPGQKNLLIFHMVPVSPEKTIGYCDYFFEDGKINNQAEELMNWESNILEKEDDALVTSVHKGMKSQALTNGFFVIDPSDEITEEPLVHFNKLIASAVEPQE